MISVVSILERIEPLAPDADYLDVVARFRADPGLVGIPVMEGQTLIGVISRAHLGDLLIDGRSDLSAEDMADCDCPALEIDVDLTVLDTALLIDQVTHHPRLFIVTRQGRYEGLCSGLDMLQSLHDEQARQAKRHACELVRLRQAQGPGSAELIRVLDDSLRPQLSRLREAHGDLQRRMARHPLAVSLQRMRHQVRELEHRVASAMELGRLASGSRTFSEDSVVLRNLMDQVQGDWEPRFAAAGPGLSVSYEGDTDLVARLDSQALRQILDCLLARTLGQGGEGVVEAGLKARLEGEQIRLVGRVRDEGHALSSQALADFADSEAPLSDLDQRLSRQLVHRMGGSIRAENNAGLGSSVVFELTVPVADARLGEAETASQPAAHVEPIGRVLIVDDNATNRIVAQALCEMFGFETAMVEDGQEAVEIVAQESFDAILMDIKMPRMDGLEATAIIMAMDGPAALTPIIALTANADPDDKARYLAAGMLSVVEKPIKPEQLMTALNQALSQAEAGQKARSARSSAPQRRTARGSA